MKWFNESEEGVEILAWRKLGKGRRTREKVLLRSKQRGNCRLYPGMKGVTVYKWMSYAFC